MTLGLMKQIVIPDPSVTLVSNGDGSVIPFIQSDPNQIAQGPAPYQALPENGPYIPNAAAQGPAAPVTSLPPVGNYIPNDIVELLQPAPMATGPIIKPGNCVNCTTDIQSDTAETPAPKGASFDFGTINNWLTANPLLALLIGATITYAITHKSKA